MDKAKSKVVAPHTFHPCRARHTLANHCLPPHPNPRIAARSRVTQAPAGATNHEQIRAAVSGRDCGWRTCNALGTDATILLTPFCHRIYQHPPRICPRSGPVHLTSIRPADAREFVWGWHGWGFGRLA